MDKLIRIRSSPVAFEDWTRPDERGTGSYVIEMQDPDGLYVTDIVSYRVSCIMAKRRTQYHQSVKLSALLEAYDPPALD